jgi:hypothetical protein
MFPIMDLILVASMLQYVTNKVALLLTLRKKNCIFCGVSSNLWEEIGERDLSRS